MTENHTDTLQDKAPKSALLTVFHPQKQTTAAEIFLKRKQLQSEGCGEAELY